MLRTALLATALAVAPAAQPSDRDVDFIRAVLGLSGTTTLVLEDVPDDLRGLLPDGAEVLGVLVQDGSPYTLVVARSDESPGEVIEAVRARDVAGWTVRPDVRQGEPSGGFVTSGTSRTSVMLVDGPEPDRTADVQASLRPEGGSFVVVGVQQAHPSRYDPSWDRDPVPSLLRHVPLLTSPSGAHQRATGGGGGGDHHVTRGVLESAASAGDLLSHYDGQMAAAGWALRASALEGDLATATWTRTADGDALMATLRVLRTSDGEYDLALVVVGPDG